MCVRYSTEAVFRSEAETSAFGRCLAPLLMPGDTLLLKGPIGAGKTHLARSIIQSRLAMKGIHEDVPSPTFTLVQTYFDGETEIWHADLYRLTDINELAELGLDEALDDAIVLIEWPERLGTATPDGALLIEMLEERGKRRARFSSYSEEWERITPCLRALP